MGWNSDQIASLQLVFGLAALFIDSDLTAANKAIDAGSGEPFEQFEEKIVEPLALLQVFYADKLNLGTIHGWHYTLLLLGFELRLISGGMLNDPWLELLLIYGMYFFVVECQTDAGANDEASDISEVSFVPDKSCVAGSWIV